MKAVAAALLVLVPGLSAAQPPPIIDMHLHAPRLAAYAGLLRTSPPIPHCVPMTDLPVPAAASDWTGVLGDPDPPCRALKSPTTDDEVMKRTLAVLERRNVVALTSGPLVADWRAAAPGRIVPALGFGGGPEAPSVEEVRKGFAAGTYAALAEVTVQYRGLEPDDPSLRPYWALAEEMQVPVGIHIGTGPVGAPYLAPFSRYRARLHSPLLLEEVLQRHPRLRVFVMHAGWPMLDDLLAMLWTYPQLHVELGAIDWALPEKEFHRFLQRIVEAGFGKRVMFGSDQMVWPDAIEVALANIESAPFLDAGLKRDILYGNAARFLRLQEKEIARHHGR